MIETIDVGHMVSAFAEGAFYVVTLIFVGFSVSIVYHWFAYGHSKALSTLSTIIYLGVSAVLFIGMAAALFSL